MMSGGKHANVLIQKYLDGIATEEDVLALDALLAKDPNAARRFVRATWLDHRLNESLLEGRREMKVQAFLQQGAGAAPGSPAPRRARGRGRRRGRAVPRRVARPVWTLTLTAAAIALAVGITYLLSSHGAPDRPVAEGGRDRIDAGEDRTVVAPAELLRDTQRETSEASPKEAAREPVEIAPKHGRRPARAVAADTTPDEPIRTPSEADVPRPRDASSAPRQVEASPPARREDRAPDDDERYPRYEARIERFVGNVRHARGPDADWEAARKDTWLSSGDRIGVGYGMARLSTAAGSYVYLCRGAKVVIREKEGDAAGLLLDLSAGYAYMSDRGGDAVNVRTPHGLIVAAGTRYAVMQRSSRTTTVVVRDGAVTVRALGDKATGAAGAEVRVETGQQTEVRAGERPSAPVPVNVDRALAWVIAAKRRFAPRRSRPLTISFQDGVARRGHYRGTRNATICEHRPDSKFGMRGALIADGSGPWDNRKDLFALVRWDLSSIPEDSVVVSASITLTITDACSGQYGLYELRRPWVEEEATWRGPSRGDRWQVPGATGEQDRGAAIVGAIRRARVGEHTIDLNRQGLALVKKWIDAPSMNHGVLIGNGDNADAVIFKSRQTPTATHRPRLTVTIVPLEDVPISMRAE